MKEISPYGSIFRRLITPCLLASYLVFSLSPVAEGKEFWLTQDLDVAGYFAFSSTFQDAPGASRLFPAGEAGLLLGKNFGNWRFFTELQVEREKEFTVDSRSSRQVFRLKRPTKFTFEVERLWLQYRFPKAMRLRAGQLLTSFGVWNPQHFPAITNTVNRPRSTQSLYPEHILGGELRKETTVFDQPTSLIFYGGSPSISDSTSSDSAGNGALGGYANVRLLENLPGKFGVSGLYLLNHRAWGNVFILGTDVKATLGSLDVQAEFIRVVSRTDNVFSSRTPQGHYLQGLWHLTRQWGLLYRWDQTLAGFSTDFSKTPDTQTIHTFGLLFTPKPWLRLKTDWEKHEGFSQWDFELSFYFSS